MSRRRRAPREEAGPRRKRKGEIKNEPETPGKDPSEKIEGPRVDLREVTMYGLWKLDIETDTCSICKSDIHQLCVECQARGSEEKMEECTVARGMCGHVFHFHCISKWLETKKVCPLCSNNWEYAD